MDITKGYYISELIVTEEEITSGIITDSYYKYYKFYENGIWISKNTSETDFNFELFISNLNLTEIKNGISENNPLDENYNFLYHSGKYQILDKKLIIHWSNKIIDKHSFTYSYDIITDNQMKETNGKKELNKITMEKISA